jgi:hypothetical protein
MGIFLYYYGVVNLQIITVVLVHGFIHVCILILACRTADI